MNVQRFGDALLKSGPSPLLSFLAPAASPAWSSFSRCNIRFPYSQARASRRHFTVQPTRQAELPPKGDSKSSSIPELFEGKSLGRHKRSKAETDAHLNSLLSSLGTASKNKRGPRSALDTSQLFPSPLSSTTRDAAREFDSRSPLAQRQGSIWQAQQGILGKTEDGHYALDLGNLLSPDAPTKKKEPPPPVPLNAFVGRSVAVNKSLGLQQALNQLNMKLAVNKVRADVRAQKFHERPGLKRKRLRRERWRRRFKEGFQAVVQKVENMRRQGW